MWQRTWETDSKCVISISKQRQIHTKNTPKRPTVRVVRYLKWDTLFLTLSWAASISLQALSQMCVWWVRLGHTWQTPTIRQMEITKNQINGTITDGECSPGLLYIWLLRPCRSYPTRDPCRMTIPLFRSTDISGHTCRVVSVCFANKSGTSSFVCCCFSP